MTLSNTAVPKYYGQFREDVLSGRTVVNEKVSMEMNRIDQLIEDPDIWYDDLMVEGFIAFCEDELTLTDGSDLVLLDSFKLWAVLLRGSKCICTISRQSWRAVCEQTNQEASCE